MTVCNGDQGPNAGPSVSALGKLEQENHLYVWVIGEGFAGCSDSSLSEEASAPYTSHQTKEWTWTRAQ